MGGWLTSSWLLARRPRQAKRLAPGGVWPKVTVHDRALSPRVTETKVNARAVCPQGVCECLPPAHNPLSIQVQCRRSEDDGRRAWCGTAARGPAAQGDKERGRRDFSIMLRRRCIINSCTRREPLLASSHAEIINTLLPINKIMRARAHACQIAGRVRPTNAARQRQNHGRSRAGHSGGAK